MEQQQIALTVKDLHLSYRMFKKFSVKQQLLTLKADKKYVFEALKGVSFELHQGEILGIIGRNGSGKSTLLKAVAGIFSPDKGSVNLHGNSISLLSIGVGFQTKLTGRENILLSGMLLGFSESVIREKTDSIIEFSELGNFIDQPVNTYSSGMHSKLAFSITAILETDIMLIDEVLSVGDEKFKKKSFGKMKELISHNDRTVVIVSHSLNTLKVLCDQVMWLHEGKLVKIGPSEQVIDEYKDFMK